MNAAEKIAERLHDDGQCFETTEGISFADLVDTEKGVTAWRDGYRVGHCARYSFPDGSIITEAGGAWDFGFPDCFCWRGAGHDENDCTKIIRQREETERTEYESND